ncbi:MAG: 4-hydroxy-tetrahydrodipicolinate reductase [Syntrophothermus sp.]
MELTYGIIGDSGKMGHELTSVFDEAGYSKVYSLDLNGEKRSGTPSVLIDFSLPEAMDRSIAAALEFGSHLILGTTGLSDEQLSKVKAASEKIAIVQSFNFSVGIQMLMKCAEFLKDNLGDWDIEISETHHRFKKDKPSGTAIMLKNAIGKDVPMVSHRLGNVAGDHTVFFGGLGEVISITHSATSRRTFAEGALKSAEFLKNKKSGLYSFKDVLFSK